MNDTVEARQPRRLIASDRVEGTTVYGRDGDKLGTVKNFMVAKKSGQAEYAVLQFGGILGIGNDYYPIPWEMLSYDTDRGGYVVDLTREKIETAPRHGEEFPDYDHPYGRNIFEYYGLAYPFI